MMNFPQQFGLQPHLNPTHLPRFGANNPFVLGVPGMGGFGKKRKVGMPRPLGLPQGMRPPIPQMQMRQQFMNPFMGQMRPY